MTELKTLLIEKYGYSAYEAEITEQDLNGMDEESRNMLNLFLEGKNIDDYSYRDYSVRCLVENHKMNIIAAILFISQLKADYDFCVSVLNYGKK